MVESLGHGRYLCTGIRDPGSGIRSGDSGSGIGDRGSGIPESHRIAYAVADGPRIWVFIDGRTFIVDPDERGTPSRESRSDEQAALSAPMPATVVAVSAVPGQQVSAGDTVIMLEAMKMELPVKAPRNGRVVAIHCREGELVQPGIPLVDLE